jgi:[ribosomal protein S18]-alanine N-acetyltransferase
MTMVTPAATISIEPMRRRHLRAVLSIEERTSSTPWSLGLFLAEVRRPERIYLIARDGSTIVGFAGLLFALDEGHVTTIAVDPAVQGGRIGTRLLLELLRGAIARGATAVTLEVRASNAAAQALYRRFGFVPAGARKDYYRDPTEDALVLWAHEVDSADYATRLAEIESSLSGSTVVDPATSEQPAARAVHPAAATDRGEPR